MKAGSVYVRRPTPDELPRIIAYLDQEFIAGKNRSLSLARRFPHTLSGRNINHLLVATIDEAICGVLAMRLFRWLAGPEILSGAMVGMVWVDPSQRGRGIGSSLVSSAAKALRNTNVAFGVLWTGSPAFYERFGWCLTDRGLYGQALSNQPVVPVAPVSCRPIAEEDIRSLEHVRSCSLSVRVARNEIDYATIPIPAAEVLCISARNDDGEGFALVGEDNGTGYFYEIAGPPSLWATIWVAATDRFARLFVNGHSDDHFSRWLSANGLVVWQQRNKTMWLLMRQDIGHECAAAWHIPYYDWI